MTGVRVCPPRCSAPTSGRANGCSTPSSSTTATVDFEYKPEELGAPGDQDFRGRFKAYEGLFFVSYGLADNLAFEMEIATISASLDKSPADTSTLPARYAESGLGDVEGQFRWRWRRETATRPEIYGYTEFVVPHDKDKPLIGTPAVEMSFGTGLVRGFRWGTMTARAAVEYNGGSSSTVDIGEYGIEYLKRLSTAWRVYPGH